jgi:hypothetical protein
VAQEELRKFPLSIWPDSVCRYSPYAQAMHRKDAFWKTVTANKFGNKSIDQEFIEYAYGRSRGFRARNKIWEQVWKALILPA